MSTLADPSRIPAIETTYKGTRFRSRLEARFAVFMDENAIRWEYEPRLFELGAFDPAHKQRYLPDFWLPDEKLWVELKPKLPTRDEHCLMDLLVHHTKCDGIILSGELWPTFYTLHYFHASGTPLSPDGVRYVTRRRPSGQNGARAWIGDPRRRPDPSAGKVSFFGDIDCQLCACRNCAGLCYVEDIPWSEEHLPPKMGGIPWQDYRRVDTSDQRSLFDDSVDQACATEIKLLTKRYGLLGVHTQECIESFGTPDSPNPLPFTETAFRAARFARFD